MPKLLTIDDEVEFTNLIRELSAALMKLLLRISHIIQNRILKTKTF